MCRSAGPGLDAKAWLERQPRQRSAEPPWDVPGDGLRDVGRSARRADRESRGRGARPRTCAANKGVTYEVRRATTTSPSFACHVRRVRTRFAAGSTRQIAQLRQTQFGSIGGHYEMGHWTRLATRSPGPRSGSRWSAAQKLHPVRLVTREVALSAVNDTLEWMTRFDTLGFEVTARLV